MSKQIDCSHGNSQKQHKRQVDVAEDIVSSFVLHYIHSSNIMCRPAN
jgi:phospho-2-dehydro-3-deoxyheptonate aldolase